MHPGRVLISIGFIAALGVTGWQVYTRLSAQPETASRGERKVRAIPVEVADITIDRIELVRTFTGTLNANREFLIAPKVSGRIEEINVDLADTVERGRVVVRLDNAEYQQALTQAEADLAVARANYAEAQSLLEVAKRELKRMETLRQRGVSSEAEQDAAIANHLARSAHLEVTKAQITRARSAVETARIRLDYSNVKAAWQGGGDLRIVAERLVDEGESVSINQPLLRIVDIDKVIAVFYVTERDYGLLKTGQPVNLQTDVYPGELFQGRIVRIAPVFRESTRQARVELQVENPGLRLKPGMFVRASVVLEHVDNAVIVPESALTKRDGETGVFVLAEDGASVRWRIVRKGIQQGRRVQVAGENLSGQVVTLGQQLLDDGASVLVRKVNQ